MAYRSLGRARKRVDDFYRSKAWLRFRFAIERARGRVCEACKQAVPKPGKLHADHILSRRLYPQLALDPANIQLLCSSCHSRKTAAQDNGFGNTERQKRRSGAGDGCFEDGTPRVSKNPHW
jgi:5-methylcytosine-specific restriction endonuclease McrA